MCYVKPGFRVVPFGRYITSDAESIVAKPGWEAGISDAIKSIGREARNLNALAPEDLLLINCDMFKSGTSDWKKLIRLLMTILHKVGLFTRYPVLIEYRTDFRMDWWDMIDEMSTPLIPWPTLDHLGGQYARLENLKTMLTAVLREMAFTRRVSHYHASRLESKLGDIAYRIATRSPIDQAERSFYLAYVAPESRPSRFASGGASGAGGKPVAMIENADPLVSKTWELYKTTAMPGPGFRYAKMISNANKESLVYYLGVYAPSLPFCIGYFRPFGPFLEPVLTRTSEIKWTEQDVLTGIRDASDFLVHDQGVSPMGLRSIAYATSGVEIPMDLPQLDLFFGKGTQLVDDSPGAAQAHELSWSYHSEWRGRAVSSLQGAQAETLITDLAVQHSSFGDGEHDSMNLDGFDLIDRSLLDNDKHKKVINLNTTRLVAKVLLPAKSTTSTSRELEVEEIEVNDLYSHNGDHLVRSAFSEHVMPPMSWYLTPNPNAVQFIFSRSRRTLTAEDRIRVSNAVNIAFNASELERNLGHPAPFNVARYLAAVTNCRVSDSVAQQFEASPAGR